VQFSVIITNYNHEAYLVEAIDSALSQKYSSQVIVVNDGNTFRPANRSKDSRLTFIDTRHIGQLAAINTGYGHCTGEVIALLDADDVYPADYLEVLNEVYETHKEVGALYVRPWCFRTRDEINNKKITHDDWRLTNMGPLRFLSTSRPYWWLGVPTSGISLTRGIGSKIFPVPHESDWFIGADQPICHRINLIQNTSHYLDGITIHYRLHPDNQFTTNFGNKTIERREEKYDQQLLDIWQKYPQLFYIREILKVFINNKNNKYRWYKQIKGLVYMFLLRKNSLKSRR
jgi:glycosyltransferase involved in cell wall biosynthesis